MQPIDLGIISGAIIGLVGVATTVGLPKRFAPVLAVLLGIGITALSAGKFSGALVFAGIITGLTASGFYSGAKATVNG